MTNHYCRREVYTKRKCKEQQRNNFENNLKSKSDTTKE